MRTKMIGLVVELGLIRQWRRQHDSGVLQLRLAGVYERILAAVVRW
jgi:hypothetical protein